MNEVVNRVNEFMCRASKYGVIVCFIAFFSSQLFGKYHILALNIIVFISECIGVLLAGFYIGQVVGESKKNNHK